MQKVVKFFRITMLWVLLLPGVCMFIGAASNQAVLISNGDKFPVLINASVISQGDVDANGMLLDKEHCIMTHATHLNALADIIDTHYAWMSIGDIFIEIGLWLAAFCPFVWLALVVQKLYV